MSKMIPLIPSGQTGPLGVQHLPRLWCKAILSTKGMLADGYDECGAGFDQMVLDGLKLDREETLKYLKGSVPTYPQFEQWVVKKKGGQIDKQEIANLNKAISGYNHNEQTRGSILSASGIPDDGSIKDAVNLNNLDDWNEFHTSLK